MADNVMHTGNDGVSTRISNNFIDCYMREANGEYVKIYLYLLRHLSDSAADLSIESMADALDHTQLDIRRALHYWQEQGLLRLEYADNDELCGICLIEPAPKAEPTPLIRLSLEHAIETAVSAPISVPDHKASPMARVTPIPRSISYSPEELAEFRENKDIRELLFVAEQYLGRTLGAGAINTIIYWYDGLKLPTDLIEYLIESCVERGHSNIRYMNAVALDWDERGIHTTDAAKAELSAHQADNYAIMRAFGISGRSLTTNEQRYVRKWEQDLKLPLPIIEEAISRTVAATGRSSFEYADSILSRWSAASVTTMEDVKRLDAEHAAKKAVKAPSVVNMQSSAKKDRFHNFKERDYDMNALELQLLRSQS